MTNSSLSSAADRVRILAVSFAAAAILAGCGGPSDGQGEFASAAEAYAARNLEKAAELYSKSLAIAPDNVDALVMLSRVKIDLGEISAAAETLAKAAALAPEDIDIIELNAQCAWHLKDYEKARGEYLRLAKDGRLENTKRAQAYAGLGVIDIALGDPDAIGAKMWIRDRARTEFLIALALDPKCASARYHLGLIYRDAPYGYLDAALEQFQFFVRLSAEADPRMQNVQRVIIPELKDQIATALAERPGAQNRDSNAAAAALKRAEEAWKNGTYKTARLRYEDAWKADPLSYPAALGLSKAWEKIDTSAAGKQKSFEYCCEACKLRPSAVKLFISAGDKAMALKRYASAVELYSRAVAASPKDITAIDGLIRALGRTGNRDSAAIYQQYRDQVYQRKK